MTKLTKKKKQLLELVNPENTYSLDAEKAILGNILLYNQNIELVADQLL